MRGLRVVQTAPNSQSQSAVAQTAMEPPLAQAAAPDAGRKPGIERLRLLVADDMAATNREILPRLDSDVRLMRLSGRALALLTAGRSALNTLRHMSAHATVDGECVEALGDPGGAGAANLTVTGRAECGERRC